MKRPRTSTIETIEPRVLLAADLSALVGSPVIAAYSVDGSGNNLNNPEWGSTDELLLRTVAAEYSDGVSSPAGADRPSARAISNALADQGSEDITSDRFLSAMIHAWGQFIDHDLDLTAGGAGEYFPIAVPAGDPYFDPFSTGEEVIPLVRSGFDPATGADPANPREQVNTITAWLDGSMIYGSTAETAAALRTFEGGHLKMSEDGLLPLNNSEYFPDGALPMANAGGRATDDELFAAGDVRANENVELTALHTLFVREHNYWADQISAAHPGMSDEMVFQQARAIVIAEIQAITFREWLPAVLGRGAVDRYQGYDAAVNPGISNEFATAAFRFGHSLLGDEVEFLDNQGREVAEAVSLADAFFNPAIVEEQGIEGILKYLASDPASELDPMVVDSVRNFLFGPPGSGGLDLASLNIQRGRDHGLANYNAVREQYGLPPVTSFDQITSNAEVAAKLEELYGSVDNIDLWVGLLAEDHAPGASVGPTAQAIIADQFQRLRDGDRFWYESVFSGRQLREIQQTTLTDIIRRNTDLTNLQDNTFFFRATVTGQAFADRDHDGHLDRGEPLAAGIKVELVEAESGEVVATATTNRQGGYRFDVFDGLRPGDYFVRAVAPDGDTATAPMSRLVTITRGDQFVQNVNIALPPRADADPPPAHGPQHAPVHGPLPGSDHLVGQDANDSNEGPEQRPQDRARMMLAQAMNLRMAAVDMVFDKLAEPHSAPGRRAR